MVRAMQSRLPKPEGAQEDGSRETSALFLRYRWKAVRKDARSSPTHRVSAFES